MQRRELLRAIGAAAALAVLPEHDAFATQLNGDSSFAALDPATRGARLETLEGLTDRRTDPARTYWRLKGLVVHGYFTSEKVMKEVLHSEVMPGHFHGNAPMRA